MGWTHANDPCPSGPCALFRLFLLPDISFRVSRQPLQGALATQARRRGLACHPHLCLDTRTTILSLAGLTCVISS